MRLDNKTLLKFYKFILIIHTGKCLLGSMLTCCFFPLSLSHYSVFKKNICCSHFYIIISPSLSSFCMHLMKWQCNLVTGTAGFEVCRWWCTTKPPTSAPSVLTAAITLSISWVMVKLTAYWFMALPHILWFRAFLILILWLEMLLLQYLKIRLLSMPPPWNVLLLSHLYETQSR